MIRCCRTQTRCLHGAPRCRRVGKSDNTRRRCTDDAIPCRHGPLHNYITRGRVPGCHRPHTRTSRSFVTSFRPVPLMPRTPGVPFIRLPERSRTPSRAASLRKNDAAPHKRKSQIRNRRYPETSIDNSSITNSPPIRGSIRQVPDNYHKCQVETANPKFHRKYPAVAKVKRQSQIPSKIPRNPNSKSLNLHSSINLPN